MALWGNKEALALTGTVATTNGLATVTGTSTVFLDEVDVGDVITVNSTFAKIIGVTSNTVLTISPAWGIANTTGVSATLEQSPKWLAAGSDLTVQSVGKVFGVDVNEATANNEIPGWVYTNVYTDMHGNIRRKSEVLASLSTITTDAEDTVYADARIIIGTQPSNISVGAGNTASFTVVAASYPTGGTVNYRWQRAANSIAAFADLTNAGTYANTTTSVLAIANSTLAVTGSIYRVQLSVTGETSANTISANAVLTIA
jgi:hypothetical protein